MSNEGDAPPAGAASEPKNACLCASCKQHSTDVMVFYDFVEQTINCVCPICKRTNSMAAGKPKPAPYPRARIMR